MLKDPELRKVFRYHGDPAWSNPPSGLVYFAILEMDGFNEI